MRDRRGDLEFVDFEMDAEVVAFVRAHPNGATLEAVAGVLALTRERVRQIEHEAIRKLRDRSPKTLVQLLVSDPNV